MKTMADVTSSSPHLEWNVFAPQPEGAVGFAYEDDGETVAFRRGADGSAVVIKTEYGGNWPGKVQDAASAAAASAWVNVSTAGTYIGAPSTRSHSIRLRGVRALPRRVAVNGVRCPS